MLRVSARTLLLVILLSIISGIAVKRTFTTNTTTTTPHDTNSTADMPLFDSTTMAPKDKTEEWSNKLVGKQLHDTDSNETLFAKKDLPEETRIIKPGMMVTKDFRENRLNVHVDDEDKVSHVSHG